MGYISPAVFRFLAASSFRLKKFEAATGVLDSLPCFRDLLDSPVLLNVEDLEFNFGFDKNTTTEEGQEFEPLIQTMANLPVLESLNLFYPLNADWIRHFEKAYRLKRFVWYYRDFVDSAPVNDYDSESKELVECLRRHCDWDVEVRITNIARIRTQANLDEGGSGAEDIDSEEDFDDEFHLDQAHSEDHETDDDETENNEEFEDDVE
jgi:hypothetical protein